MLAHLLRPLSDLARQSPLQAHDAGQRVEAQAQPPAVPVLHGVVTRLTDDGVDWALACATHATLADWHVSPDGLVWRVCVAEREARVERERYLRTTVEAIHG